MLTPDALRIRAHSQPHRTIILCGNDHLTYGDWDLRSSALARSFMRQGVRQRELVVICLSPDRWVDYVISLLALQKLGAVAVVIPFSLPEATVRRVLTNTHARSSIGDRSFYGVQGLESVQLVEHASRPALQPGIGPDALAEILVTSGTTGMPKLVACPHGSLTWGTLPAEIVESYGSQTVQVLNNSPIGSNAAQRLVSTALRGTLGEYNIVPDLDPAATLHLLASRKIDEISLVPARAAALVKAAKGISFPQVRRVHLNSAYTSSRIAAGLTHLFPAAHLINKYGLTEGGRFRIEGSYDFARPEWIGYPEAGHLIRILDKEGKEVPSGTAGELWVRDPTPYRRFYYDEGRTVGTSAGTSGWICSNDVAAIGEDGSVTLVGRASDIANVGGLKVSLKEVEEEVAKINCVIDCAAFKVPHQTMGDLVCIGVVRSPDDDDELKRAKSSLARQLGSRFPRLWMDVGEIPKTFTGKVQREALVRAAIARFPELRTDEV